MESVEQRESRKPHEEVAVDPLANARFGPHDLVALYPQVDEVSDKSSYFGGDHLIGPGCRYFSYKYPEIAEAYSCPCSNLGNNFGNKKKLFTRTNNLRVHNSYPHATVNF